MINTGYDALKRLADEDPAWIPVVRACYESSQKHGNHFAGSWIVQEPNIGWLPNLKPLVTRGILTKGELTRGGSRRYYSLSDPEGIGRGLAEIGGQ